MGKFIMVGCDLHDKSMLLKIAVDRGAPSLRSWGTDRAARQAMIEDLKRRLGQAGGARIVFGYRGDALPHRSGQPQETRGVQRSQRRHVAVTRIDDRNHRRLSRCPTKSG